METGPVIRITDMALYLSRSICNRSCPWKRGQCVTRVSVSVSVISASTGEEGSTALSTLTRPTHSHLSHLFGMTYRVFGINLTLLFSLYLQALDRYRH